MTFHLTNQQARHLWLATHGLSGAPTRSADALAIIQDLGFLQIDTIRNVVRAQDHILWSRSQTYREGAVWKHLASRDLFEHFTHDASLIPRETLPLWTRRFRELGAKVANADWYHSGLGKAETRAIRDRIEAEGPLSTHAFDTKVTSREMWARPPHKKALDQMWYSGELATARRENFVKYYDLGSRILGPLSPVEDEPDHANDLHHAALARLSFATPGELARFWDITRPAEARAWMPDRTIPATITSADGAPHATFAAKDIEARLQSLPPLTNRMRIINPFDPAFRDRARTERLFGFTYRNEMFTPAAKRQYGYYVYPLLEADRFVARMEAKADKASGALLVTGFWPEAGCRFGKARLARLDAELDRFARFGGLRDVTWTCPRPA